MPRCRAERSGPVVASVNMLCSVEEYSASSGQKEGYLTYGNRVLQAEDAPAVVSARPLQSPLSNAAIWFRALHRPRRSGEPMLYVDVVSGVHGPSSAVVHPMVPAVVWTFINLDCPAQVPPVMVTTRPWYVPTFAASSAFCAPVVCSVKVVVDPPPAVPVVGKSRKGLILYVHEVVNVVAATASVTLRVEPAYADMIRVSEVPEHVRVMAMPL
mmetsp:Transcript_18973/g.36942  ORF Transcript_18973/g.36942 Transcript_18973/m.36942 type:complete len:213 (-) Transcript_18973:1619-2257(-)